jgi:hypothetical protein
MRIWNADNSKPGTSVRLQALNLGGRRTILTDIFVVSLRTSSENVPSR